MKIQWEEMEGSLRLAVTRRKDGMYHIALEDEDGNRISLCQTSHPHDVRAVTSVVFESLLMALDTIGREN